jgi:hypothetical protein
MVLMIPTLTGMITTYAIAEWAGRPLYCPPHRYDQAAPPWIALEVQLYQSGQVKCGDPVIVDFDDGTRLELLALDAGPFAGLCAGTPCSPIIGDVPEPYWIHPYIGSPGTIRLPNTHRRAIARERQDRWM